MVIPGPTFSVNHWDLLLGLMEIVASFCLTNLINTTISYQPPKPVSSEMYLIVKATACAEEYTPELLLVSNCKPIITMNTGVSNEDKMDTKQESVVFSVHYLQG